MHFARIQSRHVARIWKTGGLFWKTEKCANDLDWNFHWSRSSFRRIVRKLRRNFSESSKIQRFFPPKIRWSQKKKKKRSSPISRLIFRPISQIQLSEGGCFRTGGLFSLFLRKSASKSQKTCDFTYFTSQWGGSSPPRPPPGCATDSEPFKSTRFLTFKSQLKKLSCSVLLLLAI